LVQSEFFFPSRELTKKRTFSTGQGTLTVGRLCISSSTPTCTHKVTATATTCDGLVSEWGLTRGVFYDYNDNVNKWCNNLVPGHAVRVFPL